MKEYKLFTAGQATGGAFLGGPFVALVLVLTNYRAQGNRTGERFTLLIGGAAALACLLAVPFLPDKLPVTTIPLLTAFATWLVVEKHQSVTRALHDDSAASQHSVWRALAISALGFIGTIALALVYVFALVRSGNLPGA